MSTIRFKSPTDEEVHVASTLGAAARVGTQWRELPPILHRAAIAAGCITDNMTDEGIAAVMESEAPAFSQGGEIKKAIIAMLAEDDPTNFTTAGLPNLNKLSARCGFGVDREQMQAIWADMEKASE